MFCPECGTENSRGQKFCTRCGTSLLAVEYARSIVSELAAGRTNTNDLSASHVLRLTAVISILGLLFITLGTIFLSLIYQDHPGPPVGMFFCMFALTALVLIVRRILKLIDRTEKPQPTPIPLQVTTNPLANTQHRPLTEGSQPYYSVTEERTRQLEHKERQ
ncbi:MAG TPA: zinc-ribbon domain-containing protein [Blastocatellia bacterium]|nr:zinc-ribbon domain-containing protein [Blastocatellia bacterium]